MLFYLLIKNHPFQNGNKRIAVTSLLVFLIENGKYLQVDPILLYRFAKEVAESDSGRKDVVVSDIEQYLRDHLIDLPEII